MFLDRDFQPTFYLDPIRGGEGGDIGEWDVLGAGHINIKYF